MENMMTPWEIEADQFGNCNCAYGCPCQFNALPTDGTCKASVAFDIKRGHFGDTSLDGLRAVAVLQWPGAIHEGHGKAFMIIDERADESQRQALLTIMGGEETEPFATMFNVFASTLDEVFEPVFKAIDLEIDVEGRRGRVQVDDLIDMVGEPIKNPITGAEHRVRIDMPDGFEYVLAEMGSGTSTIQGNQARPQGQLRPVRAPAPQQPGAGALRVARSHDDRNDGNRNYIAP